MSGLPPHMEADHIQNLEELLKAKFGECSAMKMRRRGIAHVKFKDKAMVRILRKLCTIAPNFILLFSSCYVRL